MNLINNIDIELSKDIVKDPDFFKGGSYGSVQRISMNNIECAVKYFRLREHYQKNFAEVESLSRCNHENIVKLYGAGPDLGALKLHYYIMEFAPHGSLNELLHEKPNVNYTLAQGLNWVHQCAEGVKYLHTSFSHPILHRDIKPANLLLFNFGTVVKLCDFGTVKSVQQTENTADSGTYVYMAPEVMNSVKDRKAYYNEKCDVYSIAIILWEILVRQKPFKNAPNAFSIMSTVVIKKERLDDIPGCPEKLQRLIKCCWKHQYKERPDISDVCEGLSIILRHMDCAKEPLELKEYPKLPSHNHSSASMSNDENNITHSTENYEVLLELIDGNLKPRQPLKDCRESERIYQQHVKLLERYVYLNLDCQQLKMRNSEILMELASDQQERERITRYCQLKLKEQVNMNIENCCAQSAAWVSLSRCHQVIHCNWYWYYFPCCGVPWIFVSGPGCTNDGGMSDYDC